MKLKKRLIALSTVLMLSGISAVYAQEPGETASEPADFTETPQLAGGWQVSENPEIPEELSELFQDTMARLMGVSYEPVAFLGSQLVAGKNYCFLARASLVYPGSIPYYTVVSIYEDLQGNTSVLGITDLDIAGMSNLAEGGEYIPEEIPKTADELLMGGWQADDSAELTEELTDLFERTTGMLLGVDYMPVAHLASQVVAGTRHCFLSQARTVYPGAEPSYYLVYIFESPDGKEAEVTGTMVFDPAALSELATEEEPITEEEAMTEEEPVTEKELITEEEPVTEEELMTEEAVEPAPAGFGGVLGGWSIPERFEIDEERQHLLDAALSTLLGADYQPVAYLGSQIVAGKNHCFLCVTTPVVPNAVPHYTLLYLYENLSGEVQILNIADIDIAAYSQPEAE